MKKLLFVFAAFVGVLVFANLAMAGTIDVDNEDECVQDTQVAVASSCTNLTIWWNGTGAPLGDYCAELWDSENLRDDQDVQFTSACTRSNGSILHGDLDVDFAACGSGSLRVKVCEGTCPCAKTDKNTGGDSFRVD